MPRACTLIQIVVVTLTLAPAGMAPAGMVRESPYFGLQPCTVAQPFTPSLWRDSTLGTVTGISFDPGLRHVVLSALVAAADGKTTGAIYESKRTGGQWSRPARATALGADLPGGEAAFSQDGRWLYFSSDRPPGGVGRPRTFRAPRSRGVLGAPSPVELAVAPEASTYYPRQFANGDLSFTSRGPVGGDDLFIARAVGKGFAAPEPLAGDFNSAQDDWDLVESRDGRLRIWVSARPGGQGRTDLYYSRRSVAGSWSPSSNLEAANSPALETAPSLSPDGRVLFFLRRIAGKEHLYWLSLE